MDLINFSDISLTFGHLSSIFQIDHRLLAINCSFHIYHRLKVRYQRKVLLLKSAIPLTAILRRLYYQLCYFYVNTRGTVALFFKIGFVRKSYRFTPPNVIPLQCLL